MKAAKYILETFHTPDMWDDDGYIRLAAKTIKGAVTEARKIWKEDGNLDSFYICELDGDSNGTIYNTIANGNDEGVILLNLVEQGAFIKRMKKAGADWIIGGIPDDHKLERSVNGDEETFEPIIEGEDDDEFEECDVDEDLF